MASLQQIISWFQTGLFPTADQFRQTWLSYWHKSEKIPQSQIFGLQETIEAATRGLIYQNPVTNVADLYTTYPNAKVGWAAMVTSEGYIYSYNGTDWANTGLKEFPDDVVTKDELASLERDSNGRFSVLDSNLGVTNDKSIVDIELPIAGYITFSSGQLNNTTTYKNSGFIPVNEGDVFSFRIGMSSETPSAIAAYSANSYSSYVQYASKKAAVGYLEGTYIVPSGVNYLIFTNDATANISGVYVKKVPNEQSSVLNSMNLQILKDNSVLGLPYTPRISKKTADFQLSGNILNSTGTIIYNQNLSTTDYFAVSEGQKFNFQLQTASDSNIISAYGYKDFSTYNKNASIIGGISGQKGTYVVPSGVNYLILGTVNTYLVNVYFNLIDETTSPVIEGIKNNILTINTNLGTKVPVSVGKNLVDPNKFTSGKYLNTTGGESTNSTYVITDFIPISEGQILTSNSISGDAYNWLYDANKVLIPGSGVANKTSKSLTGTTQSKYARFSIGSQAIPMVVIGVDASNSEQYNPIGGYLPGNDSLLDFRTLTQKACNTEYWEEIEFISTAVEYNSNTSYNIKTMCKMTTTIVRDSVSKSTTRYFKCLKTNNSSNIQNPLLTTTNNRLSISTVLDVLTTSERSRYGFEVTFNYVDGNVGTIIHTTSLATDKLWVWVDKDSKMLQFADKIAMSGISESKINIISWKDFNNWGYIRATDGGISVNDIYKYSDFIFVQEGQQLAIKMAAASPSIISVALFKNKSEIDLSKSYTGSTAIDMVLTIPKGISYIVLTSPIAQVYGQGTQEPTLFAYIVEQTKTGRRVENTLFAMSDMVWGSNVTAKGCGKVITEPTVETLSYLPFDTRIQCIKFAIGFQITSLSSTSEFSLSLGDMFPVGLNIGYSEISLVKKTDGNDYIQFWKTHNHQGSVTDILGHEEQLTDIQLSANSTYLFSWERSDEENYGGLTVWLSDGKSDKSWFVARKKNVNGSINMNGFTNSHFAIMWGYPFINLLKGNIYLNNASLSSKKDPTKNKITLTGDSFLEGDTLVEYGLDNRWCSQYARNIGQDKVIVSARGGGSISITNIDSFMKKENELFLSPYYLLCLSINNQSTGYANWLSATQAFIALLEANGQIPCLVTITPYVTAMNFVNQCNDWIRASGYRYADFFAAVYDPNTDNYWKDGYVFADNLHPTIEGHNALFQRLKTDLPELFYI